MSSQASTSEQPLASASTSQRDLLNSSNPMLPGGPMSPSPSLQAQPSPSRQPPSLQLSQQPGVFAVSESRSNPSIATDSHLTVSPSQRRRAFAHSPHLPSSHSSPHQHPPRLQISPSPPSPRRNSPHSPSRSSTASRSPNLRSQSVPQSPRLSTQPGSPGLPSYQLDPSASASTPVRLVTSYESMSDAPTSETITTCDDEEIIEMQDRDARFEGPRLPHQLLGSSIQQQQQEQYGASSSVFYQPSYESIGSDLDDELRAFHSQDITTQDLRSFILGLQKSLHMSGSSTHRTEILTSQVAHSLNVDVTITCFTGLLMTTFNSPPVQTIHLIVDQGLDYAKLQDLCELATGVSTKEIPTIDAMKRLLEIQTEPPLYPPLIQIAAYAVIGCFCPLLFWGGTWITSALGLFLSVIVGMMVIYLGRVGRFKRILEFFCALVSSFIAFGVSTFAPSFCPFATSLASIVWLLPGLSLTTAVTEMAARSSISGASRFFTAVLSAFQLGFGLAVGQKLVFWAPSDESEIVAGCPLAVPTYILPFCLFAVNAAFAILLNCRKSQMIPASISGVVTFMVFKLLTLYFGFNGDLTTGIAAFITGITGQLISRISDHPPLVTVLCGIMLLVPGALSVRGVTTLFVGESASGISFGLDTTLSCFAITMGLLLSKSMFPLRSKSRFYATGIRRTSTKDTGESLVALV